MRWSFAATGRVPCLAHHAVLLANTRLILPPDFQRDSRTNSGVQRGYFGGEVFFKCGQGIPVLAMMTRARRQFSVAVFAQGGTQATFADAEAIVLP